MQQHYQGFSSDMYSSGMFFKKSVCEKKINEEIDHITFNYSFHTNIQIWNQNESLTVNNVCAQLLCKYYV